MDMDSYLSTAQVAVMNQNPATSEFGPAPFLPPPPGKAGRKQEPAPAPALAPGGDRYAVFDSVQPSDTYTHNNNILQQQQQQQPGFGNTFLDEGVYLQILCILYLQFYIPTLWLCPGPPSIFSQSAGFPDSLPGAGSGPASLQTHSNGLFELGPPPPQQQTMQQQPQQQRPNMVPSIIFTPYVIELQTKVHKDFTIMEKTLLTVG